LTDRPTKPGASLKKLLEQANTAEFDDEFIRLISDEAGQKKAVEDILTGGYFTKEEIFRLNEKLNIIDKSFEYEEILESSLSRDFQLAPFITEEYDNDIIRKGSFRRLVIGAYDSTCAVCQSHLIIADTSIIDAAHILPFAKFKNDDPRNGVSLCKNHHWLFDNGAITISQDYRIRVSPNIMEESPEGFLSQYLNRKIMLPKSEEFYPAKEALMWHSRKWKHT
jgi:putative restriction endonuclease